MNLSRPTRRLASTALAAMTLCVIVASSPPTPSHNDLAPSGGAATPMEIRWVRAHLDSVLTELPTHDVGALSAPQRDRRATLLATLKSYRDRGEFPRNYDFAEPTPYFTDRKTGTLCAVGYLLASTGRRDIVDRVTRANNNVRVHELAADTALASWLDENGITLDEAARIQVVYAQSPDVQVTRLATLGLTPIALVGSLVTGTWNATGNSDGHRTGPAVTGIISGVLSVGLGAELSATQGIPKSSGLIMAGVGGATIAFAVRSLVHRHETAMAIREEQESVIIHDVKINPMIAMGRGAAPGVAVSLKF
jgi:hypothetical protein